MAKLEFRQLELPDVEARKGSLQATKELPLQTCEVTTDDYRFLTLALVSEMLRTDDMLLPAEFESYETAARLLFGEDQLADTRTRTEVLRYLSRRVDKSATVEKLCQALSAARVSGQLQGAIVGLLLTVVASDPSPSVADVQLIRDMINTLKLPLHDFHARLDAAATTREEEAVAPVETSPSSTSWFGSIKSLWRSGSATPQAVLRTVQGEVNDAAAKTLGRLLRFARACESKMLEASVLQLRDQLEPRPSKIVLVGEMKHGKSSLFNLITGEAFSPVGEATATTAAVVELRYASTPEYEGKWLDEHALESIRTYIQDNKQNRRVAEYGRMLDLAVSQSGYQPGGTISSLRSITDVTSYVTTLGQHACAVERVSIGLPLPMLRHGAVVVDTPGINDPTRVRDYLSTREAESADLIVFVMRADKLGLESERAFLLNLLKTGKAISLFVVVTHIDRLSSKEEVARALGAARTWLENVADEAQKPSLLANAEIFAFNAASPKAASQVYDAGGEFGSFMAAVQRFLESPDRARTYSTWLSERLRSCEELALAEAERYRAETIGKLPTDEVLLKMEESSARFEELAARYRAQVISRSATIRDRLNYDFKHLREDLDKLQGVMIKGLELEIQAKVAQLGDNYHKEELWKGFERNTIDSILRRYVLEFESRHKDKIQLWNTELQRFSEELMNDIQTHLSELAIRRQDYAGLCRTSHYLTTLACKTDAVMKSTEQAVIAVSGLYLTAGAAAAGVGIYTGSWTFFTFLAGMVNPATLPFMVGTAAVLVLHKMFANAEARKAKFIETKIETARKGLDSRFAEMQAQLEADLTGIWQSFAEIAERHYRPLLEETLASAEESRLRCQISRTLRKNTDRYVDGLLNDLKQRPGAGALHV